MIPTSSRLPTLRRRQVLKTALSAGGLALPSLGLGNDHALRVRFSHVVAEDTPKGLMARRLQVLLQQRSEGRIQVEVYPEAQLYGDLDEMEALRTGAVELLAPSLSKFGRVGFPEFEVFDLPFLFDDLDAVRRVTQGRQGERLLSGLRRQRLLGLGYLDNGFKHMSANRPLHEVGDFHGLRMRIQNSRVIAAQMRALGSRPVPLPFSVTREALRQGIVHGTENPLSNFWTQGMHEVQAHLSMTRHAYLGYAVITSEPFWSRLSRGDRALLGTAVQEALAYGNQIAGTQHDRALTSLREWGRITLYEPTSRQRTDMARAMEPVYAELGRSIGVERIRSIRRTIQG